jgi:hypothetical protein
VRNTLLERVQSERSRTGLSQSEVARQLGFDTSYLNRILSGERRLSPEVSERLQAWLLHRQALCPTGPATYTGRLSISDQELEHAWWLHEQGWSLPELARKFRVGYSTLYYDLLRCGYLELQQKTCPYCGNHFAQSVLYQKFCQPRCARAASARRYRERQKSPAS